MVDLDALVDIADALVLAEVILKCATPCLEKRLGRAESRFDVVSGALGHVFAELVEPERPVLGNLVMRRHLRFVEGVARLY